MKFDLKRFSYKNLSICTLPLLLSWLFLSACTKEDSQVQVAYEIISEDHLSYPEEEKIPAQYQLYENEADWNNFIPEIERVNPGNAEKLRALDFDFGRNALVIIIGEFFNYCCSKIQISGIYNRNDDLVVDFSESGPGGFTALSQAYMLLKIPKEELE